MNFRWIKTHRIIKKIFSNYIWDIPNAENKVYLTFDDGPTPEITEWTLKLLEKHNAKATFFCIGDNVNKFPAIYQKIISSKHAVGNHTFNHLNGWKTENNIYFENVKQCQNTLEINTNNSKQFQELETQNSKLETLFRPPYGKIKPSQSKILRKLGYKIIMWDVISYDFDPAISKEECLENVLKNVKSGSIIVFHDSQKAFTNLEYVLPRTLEFLSEKGFVCDRIV
ncbi:polysaccharide deacetylase family protein [Flavobacterium sp.]|uniref:polysaccharide deacetylase family protein n=1 Tax=Flavobacterium sp. TaxID=239 RepID=UPI0037530D28